MKLPVLWKDFRTPLKYQISWKSVQWGPSCSMRTDGSTDMTMLTAAFRNFANAPKNSENTELSGFFSVPKGTLIKAKSCVTYEQNLTDTFWNWIRKKLSCAQHFQALWHRLYDVKLILGIILKWNKICTSSNTTHILLIWIVATSFGLGRTSSGQNT